MSAVGVLKELKILAKPGKAIELQRFFQTEPGQYGEGDIFLGVMVPQTRSVASRHQGLPLDEIEKLTASVFHEARLCGLIILVNQYKKAISRAEKKRIFTFYMKQMRLGRINNWDLVDVTAPTIGEFLLEEKDPLKLLIRLAKSKSLWERRLSIIFTFAFQSAGELDETYAIAELLLEDSHDLIHKAVGWSLREMGKRDPSLLRLFLQEYYHQMPRTMLRYSIERLPERERKSWLAKESMV